MRKIYLMAATVIAGAAFAEGEADKELVSTEKKAWRLTVGPVMAPRVRVKVNGPAIVMPRLPNPYRSGVSGSAGNVPAGPEAGYTDRQYVDGYVNLDNATGNPDSKRSDRTWNWGADDVAGQYSNGKMEFHTENSRWTETDAVSSYGYGSGSDSDRDILLGVEAKGGWTFWEDEDFDASLDAGFRFYGSGDLSTATRYGTSVTTTHEDYRFVDRYYAPWTDEIPTGRHEGTKTGPGRTIGAIPERSEELNAATSYTETKNYHYYSDTRLKYHLWDLRLGPTFGWKATDLLSFRGGTYGLIGLVDGELSTTVNSSSGGYRSSHHRCTPVFGMAFGLSSQINLTDNIFLYGSVEYDWWSDKVSMSTGGSSATLKLSDMSVAAGIGFEF